MVFEPSNATIRTRKYVKGYGFLSFARKHKTNYRIQD